MQQTSAPSLREKGNSANSFFDKNSQEMAIEGLKQMACCVPVSIVIPAFNEGAIIGDTLDLLCREPSLATAEIIVVDDGSTDNTAAIVAGFPQVRMTRHASNRGYGSALVTAMKMATRDYIVWMDADGQHQVKDVIKVIDLLAGQALDYCIGVRDNSSYQDPERLAGKWVLRYVVNLAAGRSVSDFNSGLRGFRRDVIRKYWHLFPKGFGASTTTTLIMLERNYLGGHVPIHVRSRTGKSSVKQVRDGLRTLTLILRIFLLFKPLHFFGAIGLATTMAGFGYGLWSALAEGQGFPVLGAVVLLSGTQTMFLGLIMDQISGMRRERFE